VVLDRLAASSISYPMRFAHLLMRHPPTAQLLQDPGLATHRHPASPLPIYAHPERAAGGERQIKQLDAKLVTGYKISKDEAVVRFDSLAHSFTLRASRLCLGLPVHSIGTGHAPSYLAKTNNARNKSKSPVHEHKILLRKPIFVYF
jgi:hypothetical protein